MRGEPKHSSVVRIEMLELGTQGIEAARICRTEDEREESCTESALEISRGFPWSFELSTD